MRDLAKTVAQRAQVRDTRGLEQEIRRTLDTLHDELDDYYQVIIERIPSGVRWETYVVLETLCRSQQDVGAETLLEIFQCSYSSNLADAQSRMTQDAQLSLHGPRLDWGESYIKVVSGGLVEVGGLGEGEIHVLQFMHQTVKEFIESPRFRLQLLGNHTGKFVSENGHSFIAKHLFVQSRIAKLFFYHARESETTMGSSQHDFFTTAPPSFFSTFHDHFPHSLPSMVNVAVFAGLQLCISDAYQADPCCVQQHPDDLVSLLMAAGSKDDFWAHDPANLFDMAESLAAKGLVMERNAGGLLEVIRRMWAPAGDINKTGNIPRPDSERLAVALLSANAESIPKVTHTTRLFSGTASTRLASIQSTTSTRTPTTVGLGWETELIHQATPRLAPILLARGIDPNSPNAEGDTPIDTVLSGKYMYSYSPESPRHNLHRQHYMVYLLASHRGGGLVFDEKVVMERMVRCLCGARAGVAISSGSWISSLVLLGCAVQEEEASVFKEVLVSICSVLTGMPR